MASNPVQRIYDYLEEKEAARAARPKSDKIRFRPSEIGGCWREIWYRLSGYEPRPIDGRTSLLFMDGDLHHNVIRQLMQEAGVELGDLIFQADGEVEETGVVLRTVTVPFGGKEYDVTLSGRADGAVRTEEGMDLLEIKSVGKWKFDKFQTTFLKGGEKAVIKLLRDEVKPRAGARPSPKHANRRFWFQFQSTMLAADRTAMYIVFKNRDTGEIGFLDDEGVRHGFRVLADEAVQQEILARCARVMKALEEKKPPSTEFMDGTTPCNMCNFYQHCWGAMKEKE